MGSKKKRSNKESLIKSKVVLAGTPEVGGPEWARPTLPFKNTLIFIIFSPFALNFPVVPTQNGALLIWFRRPCVLGTTHKP